MQYFETTSLAMSAHPWIFPVLIWTLVWKGLSLWKAVKNDSKPWFVVLLVVNTFGILEILYYFVFGKKK